MDTRDEYIIHTKNALKLISKQALEQRQVQLKALKELIQQSSQTLRTRRKLNKILDKHFKRNLLYPNGDSKIPASIKEEQPQVPQDETHQSIHGEPTF